MHQLRMERDLLRYTKNQKKKGFFALLTGESAEFSADP